MKFNVLQHKLVPEHRVLTEKEAEDILKTLRVTKDQLPKIRLDDPAMKVLQVERRSKHEPEIREGDVVKITRVSETAGVSEAYRLAIGR